MNKSHGRSEDNTVGRENEESREEKVKYELKTSFFNWIIHVV